VSEIRESRPRLSSCPNRRDPFADSERGESPRPEVILANSLVAVLLLARSPPRGMKIE